MTREDQTERALRTGVAATGSLDGVDDGVVCAVVPISIGLSCILVMTAYHDGTPGILGWKIAVEKPAKPARAISSNLMMYGGDVE